jgi:hypothetical protein
MPSSVQKRIDYNRIGIVMRYLITRRLAIAALLATSIPTGAQAQLGAAIAGGLVMSYGVLSVKSVAKLLESSRPASVGDSLRIDRRGGSRFSGRATAITSDSITLQIDDSSAAFALPDLSNVRAFAGVESKWAEGWAIGLGTGMAIGGLKGFSLGASPPNCEVFCPNRDQTTLALGVFGALTGSIIGAGIGGLTSLPHWRTVSRLVPPTDKPRVSIAPMLGSRELGARIRLSVQ